MAKATRSLQALPAIAKDQLEKLGRDIAIARKRRRMSLSEMAERMMVNIKTVQRLEKGGSAVSLGIVTTALWVLGMHRRIGDLVAPETDQVGLQEEIRHLPKRVRRPAKEAKITDF